METITKEKFKPILIYTDVERLEAVFNAAKNTANQLNEKLITVENYLGSSLSDTDKLEILEKGEAPFMRLLRLQFKFPNATDLFNVTSLGKENDFEPTKAVLGNIVPLFKSYKFTLVNGAVVLSEEGTKTIEAKQKFFTENDKQNEVYEYAFDLCEKLNLADEKGYIQKSNMHQIATNIDLVKIPVYGEQIFIVNHKAILSYRQDGSIGPMY